MQLQPDAIFLPSDPAEAVKHLLEIAVQRVKLAQSDVAEQTQDCLSEIECELADMLDRLADARKWDADDAIDAEEQAALEANQARWRANGYRPDAQDEAMGWGDPA